ncbi:MAG: hypothetical protein QM773_08860 [Hyphomonadaceae bacterium]
MHSGYAKITAGLILAAVAASLVTIMSELPGTFTWAFVDFRIILGIVGLAGLALAALGVRQKFGPPPKATQVARANAALIYGAMLSLAGADTDDKTLNIEELQMIQRCCQQFFQRTMSGEEILSDHTRSMSRPFANFGFGGAEAIATSEARSWAFKAATLVARADGEPSPVEQARLAQLASRLGLSGTALSEAQQEADKLYATLKLASA